MRSNIVRRNDDAYCIRYIGIVQSFIIGREGTRKIERQQGDLFREYTQQQKTENVFVFFLSRIGWKSLDRYIC